MKEIAQLTQDLHLLCVDDDSSVLQAYKMLFEMFFKKVSIFENPKEALEAFDKIAPDIVIVDYKMPQMTGVEFAKAIRAKDPYIPIILITAFNDPSIIVEALKAGVNNFLTKPIDAAMLSNIFSQSVRTLIANRILFNSTLSQLRYEFLQQKDAFLKQKTIMLDESSHITQAKVQIFFQPKEILCGDSYVVKKIDDERFCVAIFDAMGKGLSASITSMISVALFKVALGQPDPHRILTSFIEAIRPNLLPVEILSFGVLYFEKERLFYALFGMPALFCDDQVIASNNPPLSSYTEEFHIDRLELRRDAKILLYSDGLSEVTAKNGELVDIKAIFSSSEDLASFIERFKESVDIIEDDVTLSYIRMKI